MCPSWATLSVLKEDTPVYLHTCVLGHTSHNSEDMELA